MNTVSVLQDYVEWLRAPVYGRRWNLTADNWLSNVELRE
jgi:hypothetical protein